MLIDFIMNLLEAVSPEEKERAYRYLERLGIDRITADAIAAEFYR